MGLLSNVKKVTGIVKNRTASSLGALKRVGSPLVKRVAGAAVVRSGAKVALGVGKFAGKALFGGKIRAALTIGTLGVTAIRKLRGKNKSQETAQAVARSSAKKDGIGKKLLKGAGIAAAIGSGAFIAEQLAEKAGVRGGAGFFGRRKRKKAKSSRRTRRSRSRRGSKRVSFTTRDGRRVSFTPKARTSRVSFRRKRGRRGKGVSRTELRQIRALIRRSERD